MTKRHGFVLGFAIAAIALTAVVGWQIYQMRDACMTNPQGTAACPALADVNGIRYGLGSSRELVNVDGALTPHGTITATNLPEALAEMTAYSLAGVDPALVLVAKSTRLVGDARGPYRLMIVFKGDSDAAFPALCAYLPDRSDDRCA